MIAHVTDAPLTLQYQHCSSNVTSEKAGEKAYNDIEVDSRSCEERRRNSKYSYIYIRKF